MQFHIRTLLVLMVVVSLLCGVVFAAPPLVCVVVLCTILWVCPAVWVNGIVFGRGAWRAFFIGGFMALVMRAELARPGLQFLSSDQYNQLFTMYGTIMLLFFATPIVFAFANFVVPLQIGAPDVSFPRLNAFAPSTRVRFADVRSAPSKVLLDSTAFDNTARASLAPVNSASVA